MYSMTCSAAAPRYPGKVFLPDTHAPNPKKIARRPPPSPVAGEGGLQQYNTYHVLCIYVLQHNMQINYVNACMKVRMNCVLRNLNMSVFPLHD